MSGMKKVDSKVAGEAMVSSFSDGAFVTGGVISHLRVLVCVSIIPLLNLLCDRFVVVTWPITVL